MTQAYYADQNASNVRAKWDIPPDITAADFLSTNIEFIEMERNKKQETDVGRNLLDGYYHL